MKFVRLASAAFLVSATVAGIPAYASEPAALGVHFNDMDEPGRVFIQKVMPDLTGAAIGLREGDTVTAFNGRPVTSADDVIEVMRGVSAGDPVTITVRRGEQQLDLSGKASRRPEGMQTGRIQMTPGGGG